MFRDLIIFTTGERGRIFFPKKLGVFSNNINNHLALVITQIG
jgi:hypothetical protein